MTANNHANELAALTAKLAQLEAEVAALKAQQAAPADPVVSSSAPENRSSRRRMLKKLALSAAGVAAAGTALAAGTQSAMAGTGTLPGGGNYFFAGSGTASNIPTGPVGVAGSNSSSLAPAADNFEAGVYGYAESTNNAYGVYGLSQTKTAIFGDSVSGVGIRASSGTNYGGRFSGGNKGAVWVEPNSSTSAPSTAGDKGALFVSNANPGKLYFYNGSAWVDLTSGGGGGSTSGTLTFFNVPGRYLDSRADAANNYVIPGQPQTIPAVFPAFTPVQGQPPPAASVIKYKITGSPPKGGGQIIPTSAKGIIGNITVIPNTTPVGGGYVVIWPDGGTAPATSIINYGSGQVVANSFVAALPINGILNIAVSYPTSIIIDVAGWFS